jgi:tRNA-dependent cyclodipeptide synthase
MESPVFEAHPQTPNCRRLMESGVHALIGISLYSGYYTRERCVQLAEWGTKHFKSIDFLVLDKAMLRTLQARGYPHDKAVLEARKQGRKARNKAIEALRAVSIPQPETRVFWWDFWDSLQTKVGYQKVRSEVQKCYESDTLLRDACDNFARHLVGEDGGAERVGLAVKGVLTVLPFFIDTPSILGVAESVWFAHERIPLGDLLYGGKFSLRPAKTQGVIVLREITGDDLR